MNHSILYPAASTASPEVLLGQLCGIVTPRRRGLLSQIDPGTLTPSRPKRALSTAAEHPPQAIPEIFSSIFFLFPDISNQTYFRLSFDCISGRLLPFMAFAGRKWKGTSPCESACFPEKAWIGEVQTPMPQNSPQRPCPLEVHFAFGIEELYRQLPDEHLSDHQTRTFLLLSPLPGCIGPGQTALDTGCPDLQAIIWVQIPGMPETRPPLGDSSWR